MGGDGWRWVAMGRDGSRWVRYQTPAYRRFLALWDPHLGVRPSDDLTVRERAADCTGKGIRSWAFAGASG